METELKLFLDKYNQELKIQTWIKNRDHFHNIWITKFLNGKATIQEFDELVFIIDSNARGSTKSDEAVAKTYIRYPIWYKMFTDINKQDKLRNILNQLFLANENNFKIEKINELYKLNNDNKNGLTTKMLSF